MPLTPLPSLTVAISTLGARALSLRPGTWVQEPGLDWLVLVQEPERTLGSRPIWRSSRPGRT